MHYDVANVGNALVWSVILWLSAMIYLFPLKNKKNFKLRMALLGMFCCIAMTFFLIVNNYSFNFRWSQFLLFYTVLILFFLIGAQVSIMTALYYGVWSLITFEMAYEIQEIFNYLKLFIIVEGEWDWINHIWIIILFYLILAFTVARWMPENGQYKVGPRQLLSSILLLLIYIFFTQMLFSGEVIEKNISLKEAIVLTQVYCVTVLYLQSILFKKSAMKHRMMTLDLLWHQQKEQYNLAKENIDIINRKCHDLKHQMTGIRGMIKNEEGEKYLAEIEKSIIIYDSIVKSGNEVLDTILTEKSLFCGANNIKISCVADGAKLDFIDPIDLYTIFGNAIDNAIEYVQKFAEIEKRVVDVLIYTKNKFLIINISNPLEVSLDFEEGLPISTKVKNGYHGFGLKSVQHTVQKYGGILNIDVENGCFYLKIVICLT